MTASTRIAGRAARRTGASARPCRSPRRARSRRRARRTSCTARRAPSSATARRRRMRSGDSMHVHAAGERQVALAGAQALARQVHRDQRRRAGGVDGQARALAGRARRTAGPPRRCARCRSRCRRRASVGSPRSCCSSRVVARRDADEHAGALPARRSGAWPACSSASQRHLEQQPLLRIHAGRLARRDAEECGSKRSMPSRNPPYERRQPSCRRARDPDRRRPRGPSVGRHLADRVDAVAQQPPVGLGRR